MGFTNSVSGYKIKYCKLLLTKQVWVFCLLWLTKTDECPAQLFKNISNVFQSQKIYQRVKSCEKLMCNSFMVTNHQFFESMVILSRLPVSITVPRCFGALDARLGMHWALYIWEGQRKSEMQFWKCWFMMNSLGFGKQPHDLPLCACMLELCHSGRSLSACNSSTIAAVQHPACGIRLCVSLILALVFKVKRQIPDLRGFPSAYLSGTGINLSRKLMQLRACEFGWNIGCLDKCRSCGNCFFHWM